VDDKRRDTSAFQSPLFATAPLLHSHRCSPLHHCCTATAAYQVVKAQTDVASAVIHTITI
jgi:hypothetical protein